MIAFFVCLFSKFMYLFKYEYWPQQAHCGAVVLCVKYYDNTFEEEFAEEKPIIHQ